MALSCPVFDRTEKEELQAHRLRWPYGFPGFNVSPAAAPILAIDPGKYKGLACNPRSAANHHFQSVSTHRDELARLIDRHRLHAEVARQLRYGRPGAAAGNQNRNRLA